MGTEKRLARMEEVLRHRQPDLTVVMENVHDPHNVSAILRSCDAAGVYQVHLVYTEEKFPDIGKKSSASARKWVERRKFRSVEDCYKSLRDERFSIYATRIGQGASSLYDLDLRKNVALVFGNEHRGVSDEAAAGADRMFMIPMHGMIQSLNVSVACAVTLFEAVRQREQSGQYDKAKFSEAELSKLIKAWATKP